MNSEQIDELFSRGVAAFVDPEGSFRKKVEAKQNGQYAKDIVIKLGIDPTRPDIHLGHAVILRKLRAFQDVGCKVVFLVGDCTAQIGDPTGKSKVRPELEQLEIEANMKTFLDQIGKILETKDPNVFSWVRNSDWYVAITDILAPEGRTALTFGDISLTVDKPLSSSNILNKASFWVETRMQKNTIHNYSLLNVLSVLRHVTHARLIERDMFQERFRSGGELYMHEMLYPILQGIDSKVLADIFGSCDLEIGGTDQTFNMLMGRDVMKMNKQPEQSVMALDILEGLDGKEKMSKSLDNYVSIVDEPNDMYGKIMSLPDSLIVRYFSLATYTPTSEVSLIEKNLSSGKLHPKEAKMRLAREIVAIYHGDTAAHNAEVAFTETFSQGKIPDGVLSVENEKSWTILEAIVATENAESKTEARRLVEDGAVTHLETGEKIKSITHKPEAGTYRVGKHRFFKIR